MIDNITDTLTTKGAEFQSKVLTVLIRNKEFLSQVSDAFDPKYFDANSRQWIASVVIDYFNEYRELPTYLVFCNKIANISDDALKVTVEAEMDKLLKHVSAKDLKYVQDEFLTFCKEQSIKNGLSKAIDLAHGGDIFGVVDVIRKAASAVAPRDLGHEWRSGWEERLKKNVRDCIPTPWDCMNQIMGGGLGKAELGLIAAPTGAGKSWILVALGAEAMRHGKNVLHITMELTDRVVGQRYDTRISGIPVYELEERSEEAVKSFADVSGISYIKWYANGSINIEHIMSLVHQHESRGTTFDMLIVDPPDSMRSIRKTDGRYLELKTIYEEIRSVAGELFIPCWVASQVQRSALEEEVIGMHHIAESIGKIDVADFAFTWARTTKMKAEGRANAHVVKNRNGPDATVFSATMNPPMGHIEIFDDSSLGGLGIPAQAHKANLVAKQLSRGREILDKQLAKKEEEEAKYLEDSDESGQ